MKPIFHKNYFLLFKCLHLQIFKLHLSTVMAKIKLLNLLKVFMKNLLHFLVDVIYLFVIKVSKVEFNLGLNLRIFIKSF